MKNILNIDTSKSGEVKVILKTEGKEFSKTARQKFGSQALLELIGEVLAKQRVKLESLEEVKVAKGPGSFTGLRVGVAVANALGFALGIPVNGKRMETELNY